ncbi:hypothetical protein SEA_PEPE25_96 [Microbacterium phage Pepe25]|nr:hypothetical protein SEA_PEPE25_96 [Microbacterium phage Pepe25]
MGKASRIKAQRTEPFFHEQKRPTGTHLTKKEQQEERRRSRRLDAKVEALAAKVGVAMGKGLPQ